MTVDVHHRPYDWRFQAVQLASELERAHATIEDLGAALETGDDDSVRHIARTAHQAVGSVGYSVKALHSEQPPTQQLDTPDAIGSTLTIGGSGVATIALDVMVSAMLALAATDDEDETDFLIGACLDAESAYEVSTAVVQAAPTARRPCHARAPTRLRHRGIGGAAQACHRGSTTCARHQHEGPGHAAGTLATSLTAPGWRPRRRRSWRR